MTKALIVFFTFIFAATAFSETITYKSQDKQFEGKFFPAAKKAPGILLIHNWMGITAETEKQAQRFQKLGYNVFAADIYGAGVRPKDAGEAGQLAGQYKSNRKLLRERVHLALQELAKQKNVDATKMAILGYCFGGTSAVEAGRNGENVKAIISFHGGLDSPAPKDGANIKAKVLALHGAIDPYVAPTDLDAFEKEMQASKVDYELIKYSGTVHSFTEMGAGNDITKGAAYNASSDQRSFERAKEFLAETLK